jgi:hypothetical protein
LAATSAVVGLGLAATIILYFLNLDVTLFQSSGLNRFVAKQTTKITIANGINTSII